MNTPQAPSGRFPCIPWLVPLAVLALAAAQGCEPPAPPGQAISTPPGSKPAMARNPEPTAPDGNSSKADTRPAPLRFAHVVYLVDRSGSMLGVFDKVKEELLSSIGMLDPNQDFHVIFFSEGHPIEPVDRKLAPNIPDFKAKLEESLKTIGAKGQTDPIPALTMAFDLLGKAGTGSKEIVLMTDGTFPDNEAVMKFCRERNYRMEINISTFHYPTDSGDAEAEEVLKGLAKENWGKYVRKLD